MLPPLLKRLRAYKNQGKDPETMKRKRIAELLKGRKYKREDDVWRRRKMDRETIAYQMDKFLGVLQEAPTQQVGEILSATEGISQLLLSGEPRPPVEQIVEAGILPCLTEFLLLHELPDLQSSAVSILACLTSESPSHDLAVVEAGALPLLAELLHSPDSGVQSQAALALGNLASEACHFGQDILDLGVIRPLMRLLKPGSKGELVKTALWLVQGLCHSRCHCPPPPAARRFVPALIDCLQSSDDPQILTSACASLWQLAYGSSLRLLEAIHAPALESLARLLGVVDDNDKPHILRVLAHAAAEPNEDTGVFLGVDCLTPLCDLLQNPRSEIVQETLCLIGNVAGGCQKGSEVIISAGILPHLVHVMEKGIIETRRLAAWVAFNMVDCRVPQLDVLLRANLPRALCSLLNLGNMDTTLTVLETIDRLFAHSTTEQREGLLSALRMNGGVKCLEELRQVLRKDVRSRAEKLLDLCLGRAREKGKNRWDRSQVKH